MSRRCFDFSPAEAALVSALMGGTDLEAYAATARRSLNTVRWHLKNAMSKAGIRSQRDLVRVVGATLPWLGVDAN